jgi:2',3'-cyclic-nucleotide 2'-phosphodiesterase (5'-nucleotidase family)
VIIVSGGDFCPATFESNKIKAQLIRELMDDMGYNVLAVGEKELEFGIDFFHEMMSGSQMHALAANVYHGPEKERVAEEYVILDAGGVRVGFMNVFMRKPPTILWIRAIPSVTRSKRQSACFRRCAPRATM